MRVPMKWLGVFLVVLFVLPLAARATLFAFEDRPGSWRNADWSSAGILPDARSHRPARLLVMAGRTGGWKGLVAVHTWIVLKPEGAPAWTRYDVVGWGSPVRRNGWAADGRWYGSVPVIVADISGEAATRLIPAVETTIRSYRHAGAGDYRLWPGPNSNSFVAAVLRGVPELRVPLPPDAIGRDFRDEGIYLGPTDSGTGLEFNLRGLAGVKLAWVEGLEVNLLGLVAGIDLRRPAIKLPGFGRIGISSTVVLPAGASALPASAGALPPGGA